MPIAIGRFRKQAPEERPRYPIANRDPNSTSFRTPVVSNLWFSTASPPGGRPLKNKKAGLSSGLIEMRTKLLNSLVNWCGAADIRHPTHAKHCILHGQRRQLTAAPVSHQSPVLGTRLGTRGRRSKSARSWPNSRKAGSPGSFWSGPLVRAPRKITLTTSGKWL